jgi:tRNA(Ile)-lysidine synthase
VRRLAASHGLECALGRVDIGRLAATRGTSLEVTARAERHRWFGETAKRFKSTRVILGHHADDQCETILLNLCRGSAGLKGMAESTRHRIDGRVLTFIRPLLHLRHGQLTEFLGARRLAHREDASNHDPFTPRNRLRHQAIPLLNEISGREVTPAILRAAAIQHDQALAIQLAGASVNPLDPQGRLHLPTVAAQPRALQRELVYQFLTTQRVAGVDQALLDAALAMAAGRGAARVMLAGGRLLRRKERRMFVE